MSTKQDRREALSFYFSSSFSLIVFNTLPYPHNGPETMYWEAVTLQQNIPHRAQFYIYTAISIQSCGGDGSIVSLTCVSEEIVTFTVAEMMWMKNITTELLRNQESKIRQPDMLTAIEIMGARLEGNYLSCRFILPTVKKVEKTMTQKDTYWRCPCFQRVGS